MHRVIVLKHGNKKSLTARLVARGFDLAHVVPFGVEAGCSQCVAVAIQGMACHETGCPNRVHECKGCSALVPRRGMYCMDCDGS